MADADDTCEVCVFDRTLYEENSGEDVACLQRFLASEGSYDGPETAFFGERTKAAVARWQLGRGIYSDGVFGGVSRKTYKARRMRQCRKIREARERGETPPAHVSLSDSDSDEDTEEQRQRELDGIGDQALLRGLKVALDVGHGAHPLGFEVGTKGRGGITEFDLNKLLSRDVATRLKAQGADVNVYQYERNSFGPWLTERGMRAKGHHIFVSCHHNGHNGASQGTETLVDVDATYRDQELARHVQQGMVRELWSGLGKGGMAALDRGVKWQDLGVLGTVPEDVEAACLVEPYFIDDKTDDAIGREVGAPLTGRAARGVADGIRKYWLDRRRPKFRVQVDLESGAGEAAVEQIQQVAPGAWCVRHQWHEEEGCRQVQAGSFDDPKRARRVAQRLRRRGFHAELRSSAEDKEGAEGEAPQ